MSNRSYSFDCKQIHGQLVKLGAVELDYAVGNKLALLYMKSRELLHDARQVFDEMPERTYRLYAGLIGSYSQAGRWVEVFSVLGVMILDEMLPDMYLVHAILRACGAVEFLRYGQMVHGFVLKRDTADLFVGNSVIDFYSKCGESDYARCWFDMMREKDVVSWTVLVTTYMEFELPYEGYEVFKSLCFDGVNPDLVSWNAVISGFVRNGYVRMAFCLMEEMKESGLDPNITTWNGLISGCVHSECYNDGLRAFMKMLLFQKPNAATLVVDP
ncbi:hypothetical protein L1987_84678 [Smallanthus sonchifolius]|uniref:Uncharacterized protein n=1 Tax=Smallanthus sonchifolius TaxID=185202 RepID=A0ACB8XW12_9ASTR|nr:hypothetical protein L1987_84678 [Smallanthus sonchifolius]